jgi:hypothetical protein
MQTDGTKKRVRTPVNVHVAGAIDGGRGETRPGGTFAAIAVIRRRDRDIPTQQRTPRTMEPCEDFSTGGGH